MARRLPLLLSLALWTACSSTGSSTVSSTGSASTGSGGTSSSSDCINMGSCYGNVACPVGSICFENTFVCCAYSGGSTGASSSSRASSSSHSSSHSSSRSSSSSAESSTGASSSGAIYTGALDAGPPYVGGGWPKWHYDNADQGLSPADTSKNDGTVIWKFNVGVPMMSTVSGNAASNPNPTYMNSPVVDGAGVVYQLGMDGTFHALGDGGAQLWTALLLPPNPDEHPATPIIAHDNTLYVETGTDSATTSAAQLYHIDTATGKILFQAGPPLQHCYGSPSPDGGICYTADGFDVCPSIGQDGLLFDGDDFFTYVTYKLEPDGSFTQFNEAFLLPLAGERVALALDQHDNSYWCAANTCVGVTSPSAGFSIMSGWNATTGAQIGDAPSNGFVWTTSDLAYDQNHTGWLMVEAGVQDGGTGSTEVVAMDPTDGSIHWDTKLPSGPTPGTFYSIGFFDYVGIFSSDVGNSAPAIGADGTVFVGNVDGLYAFDGGTGTIQAGFPYKPSQDTGADADVDTAPAIGGDGTIFFGTAGGTFYAIKPDGTERFHYKTGGRISSSPAIGPDGTVFFVSDDGFLYAIR